MARPLPAALLSLWVLCCLTLAPSAYACPDIDGLVDINCDRRLVIVTFGDSITFGRGDFPVEIGYPGRLQAWLPNATIVNLGKPGEDTFRGVSRASDQFPFYANMDYAIVLEGVNDFHLLNRSARSTRDNVIKIARMAKNFGAKILIANLTDIKRDNQRDWVLAVNREINPSRQIDFFSLGKGIISGDRLHPDANGYTAMANLVLPILQSLSQANRPVDTDGDGIYDFAESRFGSNPAVADSDGDGILDGEEVFTYGSSPTSTNTDGDRFSDAEEIRTLGSDPADPRPGAPKMKSLEVLTP